MFLRNLLVSALLLIPHAAAAATVSATVTVDGPTRLTILGSAPTFTGVTTLFKDLVSEHWILKGFRVAEDEGVFDDSVTFTGLLQHRKSPPDHVDGAGVPIAIDLTLGAETDFAQQLALLVPHGPHVDNMTLTATSVGGSVGPFDTIDSYNFILDVFHAGDPPVDLPDPFDPYDLEPVPVPAAGLLAGSTLALLAGIAGARRRRTSRIP